MKILIGTPIHQVKDYCMERWLKNVSELLKVTRAYLLLVDNSPGNKYIEKVKLYCKKYGIKNLQIVHIELPLDQDVYQRVARSREIIRQHILQNKFDAWFSWECDQIIPTDGLERLVKLMQAGNVDLVNHNGWDKHVPNYHVTDFNVSLIRREVLAKYSFLLDFGTDPDMPSSWEPGEKWFKERVLRGGGNCIEVDGMIEPIYHLEK